MKITTVTVIGATGTMGANVAGIFASFGSAKVYVIGRDINRVKKSIPRILKSVRADSIADNLIPADFSMLEDCVRKSDLIFESSAEDMIVKKEIAGLVAASMRKDAVSCTGTSGLSITRLAECYPESLRGNFFGVHMFNPPYSMSLCELTPTVYSDESLLAELHQYLERTLYRTVVEVKDSPAFLGNRIGFEFINEALQYADQYRDSGGVDYIDAILGPFTGRLMPPIETADFVGLDVHKAIVDNIHDNTNDFANEAFVLPTFVQKLINGNMLGRKTGGGLYKLIKYDNGLRRRTVLDINTGTYRDKLSYRFPFAEEMKAYLSEGDYEKAFSSLVHNHSQEAEICVEFLLKYILYSLFAADEVGDSIEAADDVMATGFNWCPPMAMYQALSSVTDVRALIAERLPAIDEQINVDYLIGEVKPSSYDYRSYFRAKQ